MKETRVTQKYLNKIISNPLTQGNVSAYLERLRTGNSATEASPLFKGHPQHVVLENWLDLLRPLDSICPDLYDYELTRVSKFGPQGGVRPLSERQKELTDYYDLPRKMTLSKGERKVLAKAVRDQLFPGVKTLRPLAIKTVVARDKQDSKLDTNSGLPDFGKRNTPEILNRAIADSQSGFWMKLPALPGSRGQRGTDRFIFPTPMAANLVEKSFLYPLMDAIRSKRVLDMAAWEGFDVVERWLDEQGVFDDVNYCISTDFTAMDKHMGPDQIDFVYEVVYPLFQREYRKDLYRSLQYAITCDLLLAIDKLISGDHGILSGSGNTNFDECVMAVAFKKLIAQELWVVIQGNQQLGDDGCFTFGTTLDLTEKYIADVISRAATKLGLVSNPDKQRITSDNFVYLQRFFHKQLVTATGECRGAYPTVLALNSAMNPERFHDPLKWSKDMETLRWIMILENCKHHPLHQELIEYFIKGDKYRLGLDIPNFFPRGLNKAFESAKSIKGFVPTYTEASKRMTISEFDTVKYLRNRSR
jgi:hypothetical protein